MHGTWNCVTVNLGGNFQSGEFSSVVGVCLKCCIYIYIFQLSSRNEVLRFTFFHIEMYDQWILTVPLFLLRHCIWCDPWPGVNLTSSLAQLRSVDRSLVRSIGGVISRSRAQSLNPWLAKLLTRSLTRSLARSLKGSFARFLVPPLDRSPGRYRRPCLVIARHVL